LRYYANPHNWGDLYKHTEKANDKQIAYLMRQKSKTKNKSNGRRSTKCGFCGDQAHTRRTCEKQKQIVSLLEKANANYRKWVYRTYVEDFGLSDGALIQFTYKKEASYRQEDAIDTTITTLCTGVNWDTINLFADFTPNTYQRYTMPSNLGCTSDKLDNIVEFLKSGINLKIAVRGSVDRLFEERYVSGNPIVQVPLAGGRIQTLAGSSFGYYRSGKVSDVKVISPAPQVLDDNWINEFADEMSVIFKKYSYDQLNYIGVMEHIKKWAEKV